MADMGIRVKLILLVAGVVTIACMTLIALILSLANHQTLNRSYSAQYGIVLDAGSSRTALFLYQGLGFKENDTGIITQKLSCDVDGGGISSYQQNPPAAGESLKKCLDVAKAAIPEGQWKATPAYLGATAGMRLLRLQNQSLSEKILDEVGKTIQSYPFDFRGAKIISGTEEGAFGWITINYLLESFVKHSFEGFWIQPKTRTIFGALDLGAASTQISFIPNVAVKDLTTIVNNKLYGFKYELYTHSYLCYGMDQALKKLQAHLHKTAGTSSPISHPCYPKGYLLKVTMAELYNSPCVEKPSNFNSSATVTFSGTGSSSLCLSSFENVVNLSDCAFSSDCGFNGVYQPPVSGEFFAFSSYFHIFNFLGLAPKAQLTRVLSTIETHCNKDLATLVVENPSISVITLKDYCASAHYIMTILLKGYKLNNTWDQISFEKQIADTDIGWTLGYMLNLTNIIPSEQPGVVTGVMRSQWAAQTFFIVFVLFLSLLLILILVFFTKTLPAEK
ncbi:ectonucleoside triphosphate diphosphohydrolase 8-like [Chanodichthys erythropterus]|uniref:ectonucleoside triphosphate diphosphohydrolase 8-like n=1 Tax=Chanodichthys erythropterus TaxID=933992 RepID=UPI00351E9D6B